MAHCRARHDRRLLISTTLLTIHRPLSKIPRTMQPETIVIVGAGQAGSETAAELRRLGETRRIVMVGDESQVPYRRPPLSKAFLAGSVAESSLYFAPAAALARSGIEFLGGVRALAIDRAARTLRLADGRNLAYDKLVLATGGRARPLPLPGAQLSNVFALRGIDDVLAMRPQFIAGRRVVIIGGGFIGLEVAAVAIKQGLQVTVLEGLPRVLARVTVPEVSGFFERVHRAAGVELRTGVQVAALEGAAQVEAVRLADGTRVAADLVIAGIGQLPNVELAQEAGLAVDDGIVVDEFARTADPDIYAAGDCASHPSVRYGRRLRLESVQNAIEQARVAAANLRGAAQPYQVVPWFWSDQYDVKLQMVGLSAGFDQQVLRGDPAARSFAVFYLRQGRVLAVDAISRPHDFMHAKKLVAAHAVANAAQLADEAFALKQLAA
jgi:3-phenylpropionate/trans-cinnamate dioxygenase ferredoxin reductase subunit